MLKGLGCDMIEVERIRQALSRPSFLRRVYTLEERAAIARKGAQTAAGFWAAKKALGTGFDGFALADIEIFSDEAGAPHVRLYRGAQARLAEIGALNVMVSISHTKDAAMAVAAAE